MDSRWALEVMRKAPYITVSFTRTDGTAYGVPLSLAAIDDSTWYFHCATEGDKLEAVARSLHRTAVVRITLISPPSGKRKQYDKDGEEMKYGRME